MPDETNTAISDLPDGSLAWRIMVARYAHWFFNPIADRRTIAELIGRPYNANTFEAWSVGDFTNYLGRAGFQCGGAPVVSLILDAMRQAGLLLPAGWDSRMVGYPLVGQLYISQGGPSARAYQGNLWLSEVFGAELVIESYNAVTVLIGGGEGKPVGTGLALDRAHVVTNRHVVEELVGPGYINRDNIEVHTSFKVPDAEPISRQSRINMHRDIDVAVMDVELAENERLLALPGMAFRDPKWHDEVCVFGYPYVPGLTERPITVERGEVVNPTTQAAAVGGYPRQPIFLTSAIARPGNSGGPIVAQDGRVIGLVVDDAQEGLSRASAGGAGGAQAPDEAEPGRGGSQAKEPDSSPPFYRGIPGNQVVRAIEQLGFSGLAVLETTV